MPAGGRPTKYEGDKTDAVAETVCRLGGIERDVAEALGVDEATVNRWRKKHDGFCKSLKVGKEPADDNVKMALYRRAIGYSHPEQKVFNNNGSPLIVDTFKHYPPDSTACIYWLNNRCKEDWKARVQESDEDKETPSFSVTIGEVDGRKVVDDESDGE